MSTGPSPLTSWTLDPAAILAIGFALVAYFRRARTLAARGTPVPAWRRWIFATGCAVFGLAVVSPLHAFGEEQFLFAHMVQHVLIGDLAPLAILVGLNGPLLRPLLAMRFVGALRRIVHPAVAVPLWAANLAVWHVPFLYEGALRFGPVHALEHALFFAAGVLVWAPLLEVLPAPEWFGTGAKLGYVVAVRLIETVFGNVFFWSSGVFYATYDHAARYGISPQADQSIAGAVMMIEGSLVTLGAMSWLFLRMARESELRQQLIEQGVDPKAAARAVRYGRGEELVGG